MSLIQIDQYTTYYINKQGHIIIDQGPREDSPTSNGDQPIIKYGKEDIRNFYKTYQGVTKLDEETGFIIHEERNLVFIPLSNRLKNVIDYTSAELSDYKILSEYSYCRVVDKSGKKYVNTTRSISMQEIVFGRKAQKGYKLDHEYSNPLDNRKSKIREITNSANAANRKKEEGTSSQFIGVHKANKKWYSSFEQNNKTVHLGCFDDEIYAARVRDMYSVLLHGKHARFNFFEDKKILTDLEIQNIIDNGEEGIPEEMRKKEKNRVLPKNIYRSGNNFFCRIAFNGVTYQACNRTTVERSEEDLLKFKEKIDEEKKRIELTEICNIEDNRNNKGFAIIRTYNHEHNINGEYELEDDDWHFFHKINWTSPGKYAISNGKSLHIEIYKRMDPSYNSSIDSRTVDHIDRNKFNCRRSNLRLATKAQQTQNRIISRNCCLRYTGVRFSSSNFIACYKDISKGPYKYVEDAAREYNRLSLHDDENNRINVVPETKTSMNDLLYKNNLSIDYIQNIQTISEIKSLFAINKDWANRGKVFISKMKVKDINKYRDIAILMKTEGI